MTTRQPPGGSTLERALLALEKMEAKLVASERAKTEPLAIVGMACRFPGGASSPAALWQMLHAGTDAVTEMQAERWAYSTSTPHPAARWAGQLDGIDRFDAAFFGIGRNEAADMDPQHRLLLEVAWEALEDAGMPPERLLGGKTGVFVGISSHDYGDLLAAKVPEPRPHVPTGNALSFAAGRIAYTLGLRGPSMIVDTACSSSLVALHLASHSLRRGECDVALVGGVNLLLSPDNSNILASLQILSPDGRSRTFDARANGYVRSEGVGIVVLERLSDAQRRGDRIHALVRGTATNQNGRATSLTAPNLRAQAAVLHAALENARVAPERVGYVEVHSNGSPLGDPVEIEALRETLGKRRADGSKCVLGAIKTNIGHTEAASGMASLIKAALVLNHETIPRNLHFENLNPNASLDDTPFVIPRSEVPWARGAVPRIAGVSATGLSGANAHVVLEEPPEARRANDKPERPIHLFVLSGKTDDALRDRAKQMARHVPLHAEKSIGDTCHTLGAGRAHFEHRFAAVVSTHADVTAQLADFLERAPSAYLYGRVDNPSARKRVAFSFPGRGAQARGALGSLDAAPPALKTALERADDAVQAQVGRRVLPILRGEIGVHGADEAVDTELALFVLQYALVETWKSWGIEPSAVIGEGTGECVAAWASGALELGDAILLAEARARFARTEGRDAGALSTALAKIKLVSPRRTFFPSLGGTFTALSLGTKAYWERQVRESVDRGLAIEALTSQGLTAFLKMGRGGARAAAPAPKTGAPPVFPSLSPGKPPVRALFETLAALYVLGVEVNFEGVDAPHPYRRIGLPTYPFQRQRYWFGTAAQASAERVATDGHPLLGHTLDARADRPDVRTWEIGLDEVSRRRIGVRRLAGASCLSTGGLVEVALAAAFEIFPDSPWEVSLTLGDPPALHEQAQGTLQTIATPTGERSASLGLFYRDRTGVPWRRIAQGTVEPSRATDDDDDEIAPPSMRPGRRQGVATALWELRFDTFGVDAGAFQIDQVWRRDTETLARVTFSNPRNTMIFLRAAAAVASITHPAMHGRSWMVESIEGASVRQTSALGRSWLRLNWSANDGFFGRVSVEIVGEDGGVAATVRRIDLRAEDPANVLRAAGKDPLEDSFVDLVWRELPSPTSHAATARRWIVLADAAGAGASLGSHLHAAGDTVITLPAADLPRHIDRLDRVLAVSGPFFGVVYLGALDAAEDEPTAEDTPQSVPATLLSVIDRLAAQIYVPRLWIVTRGAQVVTGDESPAFAQAGAWGLGRVLSLERPDMWGGLIDLDPQSTPDDALGLVDALVAAGPEDHVALRGGKRHAARLARTPVAAQKPLWVRPDRTYLVTGSRSLLGDEAVRWLVERGARSLLLVHPPSNEGDATASAARALAAQGIVVVVAETDLASVEAARDVVSRAPLPLGGVIHAAGAASSGSSRLTSREATDALHCAESSKIRPLRSLHAVTKDLPLDFFLVFSSAPAALGWEGLGADAVAAEEADALSRWRRQTGRPAAVVHLAFPDELHPGRTEPTQALLAAGLQGMPPSFAMQAAERLSSSGRAAATVAWIDWALFEHAHPARTGRPLFEGLGEARGATTGAATLQRRVVGATPDQARRLVESVVRGEVAQLLGVDPSNLPTHEFQLSVLGMDSIMAVQLLTSLGAAFGVSLPVSTLLTQPTIEGLSRRILASLRGDNESAPAVGPLSRRGLLVELIREGTKPPFFLAPPITGSALFYQSLTQYLGAERPFYSFNAPGVDADALPCDRLEVIAGRFVEALRQAQPRGPYRLGGYSFGSFVAFEMARILERAGERIEALVLADVPAPSYILDARSLHRLESLLMGASVDDASLGALSHEEHLTQMAAAVSEVMMLPPEVSESERQIRLYRAHFHALTTYAPSRCAAPVTLLRAEDTVRVLTGAGISVDDPTLGWQSLCAEPVRVHDFPGNHYNIFLAPAVVPVAELLRQVLEDADGPGSDLV